MTNTPAIALDRMLVLFLVGEREAAVSLVASSGLVIINHKGKEGLPKRIQFNQIKNNHDHEHHEIGAEPFQVSPGLFAYRITSAKNRAEPKGSPKRSRPSKKRLQSNQANF